MIIVILLASRNQSQHPTPNIAVYAINLAGRKIICEFKNLKDRSEIKSPR